MYGFNLSTHSFTSGSVKGIVYFLLSLLIFALFFYNYSEYESVNARLGKTDSEIHKINEQIMVLKSELKEKVGDINLDDEKPIKQIAAKIDFINTVIYEKNFSWSELFYSLEKASPRNVSITSIKPSYDTKKIKISGDAKTSKDIETLVANLQKTSFIKKSYLLRENEKIIDKKYRALTFDIEAEGDF